MAPNSPLLPLQNTWGNWVKVVQRLPVRVRLLPRSGEPPLRAGMTATMSIDIGRKRSLAGMFRTSASAASQPCVARKGGAAVVTLRSGLSPSRQNSPLR
jgi:hypothetical protein